MTETALLVGNDVVALDDPVIAHHHENERWLRRVLHPIELHALARASQPHTLVWSLFAAKEAAYKVVSKILSGVWFAHRRFIVRWESGSVSYEHLEFPLSIERGSGWVHALVSTIRSPLLASVRRPRAPFDPSAAVRELAREGLASHLGCSEGELEIRRDPAPARWDRRGPPYVVCRSRRLSMDVSLSHDGPFVAFAASEQGGRV